VTSKKKTKCGVIDKVSGPRNHCCLRFLNYLVVVAKNMRGAKMYELVITFSLFNNF